ncbi:MAG: hypothetical protein ACOCWS_05845 [Alkalispirochaetaceae bacterium]
MTPLLLALLFLSADLIAQTQSQTPTSEIRVHVLPAVNRTGEAQFEAVATTVTDTVALTLRLLGRYTISEGTPEEFEEELPLPPPGERREAVLAQIAEALPAETIVFGEVVAAAGSPATGSPEEGPQGPGDPAGGGVPELILSVYDRLEGRVVLTERRRPSSLFDIFGATDDITAALLTGFSGRRVAFGSIRIIPEAGQSIPGGGAGSSRPTETPDYEVFLDREPLGRNLRSVDSVLTGEHELRITAEVSGETRVLLEERINVEERSTTEVRVLLPDLVELGQRERGRRAEEVRRLNEALAALEAERRADGYELAESYYLSSGEFIDPEAIREAARANAAEAARVEILRGRTLLEQREWERGVASHRQVAELARTFDAPQLFGFEDEVGLVSRNWAERTVQRSRRPYPVMGVLLLVIGQNLSGMYADPDKVAYDPESPLQQGVFTLPLIFGAGYLAIWNSLDWDWRVSQRELRRYGTGEQVPSISRWSPHRWELSIGSRFESGNNLWRFDFVDSSGESSIRTVGYAGTGIAAVTTGRYWFNQHHALGLGFAPRLRSISSVVSISDAFTTIRQVYTTFADWTHTRTGRGYIRAGLEYTWVPPAGMGALEVSSDAADPAEAEGFARTYFYGESDTTRIDMFGLRVGTGVRFGRRPALPWDLGLAYRMDLTRLGDGEIAPQTLLVRSTSSIELTRAFSLGPPSAEQRPLPSGLAPFETGLEEVEGRWAPLPVAVRADSGGMVSFGPLLGVEWFFADHFSLGLSARLSIFLDYGNAGFAQEPMVLFPGLAARYYLAPQGGFDRAKGFYFGGAVEYHDFARGESELRVEAGGSGGPAGFEEYTRVTGHLLLALSEAGYRVSLWRSAFLEAGVQVGWAFGPGRQEDSVRVNREENTVEVSPEPYRLDPGPRISPVLAFGTRLY